MCLFDEKENRTITQRRKVRLKKFFFFKIQIAVVSLELEQSGCNQVGYRIESSYTEKQLSFTFTIQSFIIHRNCNGKSIERWAWRNGTKICNIEINDCLLFFFVVFRLTPGKIRPILEIENRKMATLLILITGCVYMNPFYLL